MASNLQHGSLAEAPKPSPTSHRRPPPPPSGGQKKERRLAPPVPPPKKPSVDGAGSAQKPPSLGRKPSEESSLGAKVQPSPSRKKRLAPQPPSSPSLPKATAHARETSKDARPVPVVRSISSPVLVKNSTKQLLHSVSSVDSSPPTHAFAGKPVKPTRAPRTIPPRICAQDSLGIVPALTDDQNDMYAVPRVTEAPRTPPPPVPFHRSRSRGPPPQTDSVYEEVEAPRAKLPSSRQSSPARAMAAYEEVSPRSATTATTPPHPDMGLTGEYAEPDVDVSKSSRFSKRQTVENVVVRAALPHSLHGEDHGWSSPPPSSPPPAIDANAVYSYSQLQSVGSVEAESDSDGRARRHKPSETYDHPVRHEVTDSTPAHIILPGYDRIVNGRASLSGRAEELAVVAAVAAAAESATMLSSSQEELEPDTSSGVAPLNVYSEVRTRPVSVTDMPYSRKSIGQLPHQDSDVSIGPPISPYQGTPMLGNGYMSEMPEQEGGDGVYSSVDDPLVTDGNHLFASSAPAADLRAALQRRSRSLDDIANSVDDSAFDEAAERQREDVQAQRSRRAQQHSYEYVEVKLKPKPVTSKRSGDKSTSAMPSSNPEEEKKAAEKWKAEADKLRHQRMQRHNYDMIVPMQRPRLQSFEAPPSVSLEKVAKPKRVPVPVASFQSGEELAWDDSELEQLASTPPAVPATKPTPTASVRSHVTPSKPQQEPAALKTPNDLAAGWEEVYSEFGMYYFHADSGVTQWHRPSASDVNGGELDDQPVYASPSSAPYVPSIVDQTVREMTQQPGASNTSTSSASSSTSHSQQGSGQARRQLLWAGTSESSAAANSSTSVTSPERMQTHVYHAKCIGYVEVAESLLTQRSQGQSGCVMTCINRLQEAMQAFQDGGDIPQDIRLEDTEVYLKIIGNTIKVVESHTSTVLLTQSLQGIRLWGVSSQDQNVFAFVARDQVTQRHRCRIYRCKMSGKKISRLLRTSCDQILQERKVKQDNVEKPRTEETDGPTYNTPRSAMSPTPSAELMSTTSPTTSGSPSHSYLDNFVSTQRNPHENIDPLLREDKECFAATYLGLTDVPSGTGVETIRNAVSKMKRTDPTGWLEVVVEVSAVKICLVDQKTQVRVKEHRVRFLTFLGLDSDVTYCAYIMSSAKDKFWCHVFMCEKTSGKMVLALQKACKARFQRVLESQETEEMAQQLANKYLPAVPKHQDSPATSSAPTAAPRAAPRTAAPATGSGSANTAAPHPAVPESSLLSILHKLNRKTTGRQGVASSSNPYFLSVSIKYYGSDDVGSASAGVKYVQAPFEHLTDPLSGRPLPATCTVDSNGLSLREVKSKLDIYCPVDKITFTTMISNHVCLIVDDQGRNVCHIIGPDKSSVSLSGMLSSLDAAIDEHVERMCGGRQITVNDTS